VKVKRIKFKREPRNKSYLPYGGIGRSQTEVSTEVLEGSVQGMPASAAEERMARALEKKELGFQFRVALGAPRNMPGFKEVDFIVESNGILYGVEVDSPFTHAQKGNADVLHDAIVINELSQMGMTYPNVIHANRDGDLIQQDHWNKFVEQIFS
jgi:hypothetical protein